MTLTSNRTRSCERSCVCCGGSIRFSIGVTGWSRVSTCAGAVPLAMEKAASLEASQMMYSYDFNTSRWTSLPLGVRIGKMVTFGKQPVRLYADAEYNFADTGVAPAWTFRFAVVPLL